MTFSLHVVKVGKIIITNIILILKNDRCILVIISDLLQLFIRAKYLI